MHDLIQRALNSTLLNILEVEPYLAPSDAEERALHIALSADIPSIDEKFLSKEVERATKRLSVQGVVNPQWLLRHQLRPHFFLMQAEGGHLRQLSRQSRTVLPGTSQYILYGDWDSLLILYGTDDEAEQQLAELQQALRHEVKYFSSREVGLLYRHPTVEPSDLSDKVDENLVNEIAKDYLNPGLDEQRRSLEAGGVLLGPTWLHSDVLLHRVVAFVGIDVVGHEDLNARSLVNLLQQRPLLERTLVHLYKTEQGRPFDFFAKLICNDMVELDRATDDIGYAKVGSIRFEGNTMIVANGVDRPPSFRKRQIRRLDRQPELADLDPIAKSLLEDFGASTTRQFNARSPERKLSVLASLTAVCAALQKLDPNFEWFAAFKSSVDAFARSSVKRSDSPPLTGAVMESMTAVEAIGKRSVRRIVDEVYDGDYIRAQKELKLPTKDFRKLALGKTAHALRAISSHPDFAGVASDWPDHLVPGFEAVAQERNSWAHADVADKPATRLIGRAERALVDAMALARTLSDAILVPLAHPTPEIAPAESATLSLGKSRKKGFGVFIIHSSKDKAVADSVATAIKGIGYDFFYSDWQISPGESIVERIETELRRNDTMVLLLSPDSVKSKWVNRELSAALMKELNGQDVLVLPALVRPCKIPAHIEDKKYIDLSGDFQDGIVELIKALAQRRADRRAS